MARPFYEGLRALYPGASICLMAKEPVLELDFPGLFDEKRPVPPRLSRERFELAISLPCSFSSAWLLFRARIPRRIGFSGDGNRWMWTDSIPWTGRSSGRHKSELFRELLTVLPADGQLSESTSPSRSAEVPTCERESYIVVAPEASIPLREWPYVPELLRELRRRFPERSVRVVGVSRDGKWSGCIRRLGDPWVEDWVGRTTLSELTRICRRASLVVANDSGVAHLAATLADAPTVVLFGPGDPVYVAPQGKKVAVARVEGLACSPCEKPYCRAPYGYARCLRDLRLEPVMARIESFLG